MSRRPALLEFRLLLLTGLALSALSYVTNIFLANAMNPHVFGSYSYALVLGALFGQLINFGTSEVAVRLEKSHGNAALDWIFTLKLANFALLLAATLLVSLVNSVASPLFGMVVALNSLSFASQYEVMGRNVHYAVIYLVERALITMAIWIGLLVLDGGYLGWVFGAMALFQLSSLSFQYFENRQSRLVFDFRGLLETCKEGRHVLVFELSKFSFGGVTRILIFNQLGDERMGVFSTAWQFVPLSTLYFAQATKAWRLRITASLDAGDAVSFWRHVRTLALVMMLPAIFAAVAFICVGDKIFALFFSSSYSGAGSLMPYIGVYFVVVAFDSVVVLLAIAASMARLVSQIYLVFGILTVFACAVFMDGRGLNDYMAVIVTGHFLAVMSVALFLNQNITRALR